MSVDSHTNASFASPVSMWEDRRLLPYAGNHVIVELKGSRFLCGLFRIVYGEVGHILTSTCCFDDTLVIFFFIHEIQAQGSFISCVKT